MMKRTEFMLALLFVFQVSHKQRDSDGDDPRQQSPTFKDRTKMNPDALQTGILTLDLVRSVISDSGVYSCLARVGVTEVGRTNVELQVKVRPGPGPGPGAGAGAGAIAGGVVGGAVALTTLGLVAAAFKRKKSSKGPALKQTPRCLEVPPRCLEVPPRCLEVPPRCLEVPPRCLEVGGPVSELLLRLCGPAPSPAASPV